MMRSAKLVSDQDYVTAQERVSMFPYYYYTALVPNKLEDQFPGTCPAFAGGCKQFNVNARSVVDYDRVIPGSTGWTRIGPSRSTELFGGPFKARGDGALMNPDALSTAWTPDSGYTPRCTKRLSEVTYDTWACQTAKNASEDVFDLRGGVDTRQSLQYIGPC
jgi:hypothetical protein